MPMNGDEFRKRGHELVDWMADFLEGIEQRRVTPGIAPGDVLRRLPLHAPEQGEPFDALFRDFESVILPGMTHWQHPSFFAYFPANSSPPSVLAEMLTATLGAQCMSWATSPAATELEQRVMEWLREMLGLPAGMTGVIQDTASSATLAAILSARERASGFGVNKSGLQDAPRYTVYCSREAHSSVEKAVKIAGLGADSLRKIAVEHDTYAMIPADLERAIAADMAAGLSPLCIVATMGTTGSTAVDPIAAIGKIASRLGIWLHVDGAYAGTALLLPEKRWMAEGMENVDSFVTNPHKWMFTNFDCSAYFVRDPAMLVRTFEILPEYLKTPEGAAVRNYRDWGIQLGRRFRALKLWFVIRSYGVNGLRDLVGRHCAMAGEFAATLGRTDDFELLAPVPLGVVCFRHRPQGMTDPEALNRHNEALLKRLNDTGKVFLSHTRLGTAYTIRMVIGQTTVAPQHVGAAWNLIVETARTGRG
jgi:aromatic-L-amino-acid/L-tryptophan decarboxylase